MLASRILSRTVQRGSLLSKHIILSRIHQLADRLETKYAKERDAEIFGQNWKSWIAKNDEKECLYPSLSALNLETENRSHTLNVTCQSVLKFIKLGAINKNMAVQYCHYLADVARESSAEDLEYYSKICYNLMNHLIRQDIPDLTKWQLFCDVADTGPKACEYICNQILNDRDLCKTLKPRFFHRIIIAAYKYQWWTLADKLVLLEPDGRNTSVRLIDPFISALKEAAANYKNPETDDDQKQQLKKTIADHMMNLFEANYNSRIQFITDNMKEFTQALDDFGFDVVKNPLIKFGGHCTACDTRLPVFDKSKASSLNQSIRQLMLAGEDKGLLLNTTKEELKNFDKFLEDLRAVHKRPIDLVIDGLNIAYRNNVVSYQKRKVSDIVISEKYHRQEALGEVLMTVFEKNKLLARYKNILVIGKRHMTRWKGLLDFFDKNKIHYYLLSNSASDDLFQLYASTLNPQTVLISGDMFRDHLFLLDIEKKLTLARWIDTRRGGIINKGLKVILPTDFEKVPSVDRERGCFHVPMVEFGKLNIAQNVDPTHLNHYLTEWVCCHLDSSKRKKVSPYFDTHDDEKTNK